MAQFQLTREQSANLTKLVEDLQTAKAKISEAVDKYNESVSELRAPVEVVVTEYNEILGEVRTLCNTVANKAQDAVDEKSESWQDSDRGQSAIEWQLAWEGIELDDVDYQWPDELTIESPQHDQDLQDLPEEMEA